MRFIFVIVTVSSTFLGLFGSDCRAQSTSRFQLSDGTPLLQSAPLARDSDGETSMVWVAEEGYRPRYSYQDSATKVPRELKFMEPLWLVEPHKDPRTDREYLLLAKADPGGRRITVPYGWVNGEVCVRTQEAMKNAGTQIYRKAMIVNRPESVKSALEGDSSDLLQGAFRAGPSDRAGFRTDVFRLHNLLFVYAETEQHYLLGVTSSFGDDPTRVVKGWVSKNRVSRWDTRIALEWDVASAVSADRSERGVVWDKQDSAQDWHDRKTVPDSAKSFIEAAGQVDVFELSKWPTLPQRIMPRTVVMRSRYEPTELIVRGIRHYDDKAVPKAAPLGTVRRASLPFAWDIPRMPMLDKTKKDPRTDNILYKVGWIGAPPFEDVDERLERAGNESKNIDVLILVDDTQGMDPHFDAVANGIGQLFSKFTNRVATTKGDMARSLRMAVAYYSDEHYSQQPFKTSPLKYISSRSDFAALAAGLGEHKKKLDGGGDAPESVYKGILHAIKDAKFRPYGYKLLVVVGDMGDKSHTNPSDERKLRSEVVAALFPSDPITGKAHDPIDFCAFRVRTETPNVDRGGGSYRQSNVPPDGFRFETQMNTIVSEVLKKQGDAYAVYAPFQTGANMCDGLVQRVAGMDSRAQNTINLVRRLRLGSYPSEVGEAVRARLGRRDIPIDKLLGFKGAQVYDEGYVWRHARTSGGRGAQQVRPMVLLRNDAIDDIVKILRALVGERPAGVAKKSFKDLYEAEVERLLGQEDAPKDGKRTISDVYFMKLGLPANSPLLRRSPTELDKVGIGETELEILKLKLKILEDILHPDGGIRRDWRMESARHEAGHDVKRPTYKSAVWEERFFTLPGDPFEDRWCWIDLEEEWP